MATTTYLIHANMPLRSAGCQRSSQLPCLASTLCMPRASLLHHALLLPQLTAVDSSRGFSNDTAMHGMHIARIPRCGRLRTMRCNGTRLVEASLERPAGSAPAGVQRKHPSRDNADACQYDEHGEHPLHRTHGGA